jgi:hypothetical protein
MEHYASRLFPNQRASPTTQTPKNFPRISLGPLEDNRFDVVIDASGVSKLFADSAPIFQNLHKNVCTLPLLSFSFVNSILRTSLLSTHTEDSTWWMKRFACAAQTSSLRKSTRLDRLPMDHFFTPIFS